MSEQQDNERSAVQLLQDINNGLFDPKLLDKPSRQNCVELLVAEGYTISHIAQVLKWSEKTISRDLKEIQDRHALTPDLEFAKRLIGEMYQKALNHHAYLVRLARGRDASVAEKIQSEFAAWKVLKELIEKLQTLGYLPLKPTEIVGTLFHYSDADKPPSIDEMRTMVVRIEQAAKEAGILDEEAMRRVESLRKRIEQLELAQDIKKLEDNTNQKEDNHEER